MNIDLLVTPKGETGLLSSDNLITKAIGAMFDPKHATLSLEFTDMDHMDLNIPVEPEFHHMLDMCPFIHFGSVKDGKIAQAYQVPLMFVGDFERTELYRHVRQSNKPLESFHYFVKSCVLGQPVHRDDAGNEDTLGCILGDTAPSSLEIAKHLARRHVMEVNPSAAPQVNAPGLGLGGSGSAGTTQYPTTPPKDDEKD